MSNLIKTELQNKTERAAEFMQDRLNKSIEIYRVKNVAYGDSFGVSVKEFGPIAGLVRMGDKFNRVKSLLSGNPNNVADESIEDTLIDLANYSMMLAFELREVKAKEKEGMAVCQR